ncbi:MAG: hypothetical protein R3A51_13345 [Nannocystaceae bacterium]|nr:hypothetical protein [Myxococcales bacterium]
MHATPLQVLITFALTLGAPAGAVEASPPCPTPRGESADALWRAAQCSLDVVDVPEAVTRLRRFATVHPEDPRSVQAYERLVPLLAGLGDHKGARAVLRALERKHLRALRVVAASRAAWAHLELAGDDEIRRAELQAFLDAYGETGAPALRIAAAASLGELLWQRSCVEDGDAYGCVARPEAAPEAATAAATATCSDTLKQPASGPPPPGAREPALADAGASQLQRAIDLSQESSVKRGLQRAEDRALVQASLAKAEFHLAQRDFERLLRRGLPPEVWYSASQVSSELADPEGQDQRVLVELRSARALAAFAQAEELRALERGYARVIARGQPTLSALAATRVAQLHQHVASSLLGVPSLRGAASRTPWAAEYCEAFAAYARPHVRAAIAAFGQCHAFAERHRGAAAVKKTCLDGQDSLGRGRSRPELLPAAGELPTKPRRAGVQLDVD